MVLLARSIPLQEMGVFSSYINIIGILLLITNFGFSEYLLVNSKDNITGKDNFKKFSNLSILIFIAITLGSIFLPIENIKLFILVLLKIYFEVHLYNILLSYYQAINQIKVITVTNIVSGVLFIVISLLCYYFDSKIYSYLIFLNIAYIVVVLIHSRYVKFQIKSIKSMVLLLKEIGNDLKYYGLTTITVPIYMMAPTVIASLLLSEEVLARYQVAFSISNIVTLISVSILQANYPQFLSIRDDIRALRTALIRVGFKIISFNIVIFLIFITVGKDLLLLVYKKAAYADAYLPILMLLIAYTIFIFASILAVIMVVHKRQKQKSKFHIEFIIISLLSGLCLIHLYGILGVTISYIVLYTYTAVRYLYMYNKIHKSLL
ncbi:oligosaccharide flippase family protein [Aquimarina sp. ERC-38]|uniref:oligosaccharide flippase family protein n=1 Tax=Aquimarina sp. ERC-38 TaxID=2949996 RepID=UPI0022459525|nr:oligosaccharide flippase family protein [Aquimarina sp. ERC-38]UZO81870.1 oligosaccharide flippase family protein [Aquimarina sp. ERC-38]